jgi:hypothetical protein
LHGSSSGICRKPRKCTPEFLCTNQGYVNKMTKNGFRMLLLLPNMSRYESMREADGQKGTERLSPTRLWVAVGSWAFLTYLLLLGVVSLHLYRSPTYDMDSIQYMGNALLMERTDVVGIHRRVYAELGEAVPKEEREPLLGYEPGAPADQNASRLERAANPYRFGEFLPMFAIRPLYNQTLYWVSKTGLGLVRAGIFISVVSYFLIGVLFFLWIRRHANGLFCLAVASLVMISPPLTSLGRDPTSDALATLVAFASLYMIFEMQRLTPGLILLLASIFFRTDFVVLAGPTILACWLDRRIDFWKASILAALALSSALCIGHFAGDYGMKMLYYRNFVGTPIAPGEMTVQFSTRDYLSAFRSGITKVAESFFVPFLLLGAIGLRSRRMMTLFAVSLAYVMLHFVVLPNWQERWVGLFYLCMAVCAVTGTSFVPRSETRE